MKIKTNKLVFLAFSFFSGVIALFQFHIGIFGYIGIGGMFVPDSLGMQHTINLVSQGVSINYRTILGVLFLYYPSVWLGFFYSFFINCTLLYFACHLFLKTIERTDINLSRLQIYLVFFVVSFNFYICSVLFHPNKEIPLIFLTNAFIYFAVAKQRISFSLVTISIVAMFRDAYALILLFALIAVNVKTVARSFYRRPYLITTTTFILLSFFSIETLSSLNILPPLLGYVLDRNIAYGEQVNSILGALPSYLSYSLKLINNLSNGALRPQFLDLNGRVYFTGIGLWQFGVTSLLGMFGWIYAIRRQQNNIYVSNLALVLIACFFLISVGTFTQPRYLMPHIFWLAAGMIRTFRPEQLLMLFSAFFLISQIFSFMGLGVLVPQGFDIYPL